MNTKRIISLFVLPGIFILACGSSALTPGALPRRMSAETGTLVPVEIATELPVEEVLPRNAKFKTLDAASRVERDIAYCTMDGVVLRTDVYFPKNEAGILLIYIHGGGWRSGSKNGGSGFIDFPALLDAGFTLASIDYRLAPAYTIPDMVKDVKCAVRYFRAHAADYLIDPDRIGVWGSSAGGHLVSMLGTADESAGFDTGEYLDHSSRVQAVVSLFGPANLGIQQIKPVVTPVARNTPDLTDLAGPDRAAVSPVTYITADDPPFLLLHGDEDKTVLLRQSLQFYDLLTAAGVEAQLVVVKGGAHGLNGSDQTPSRGELTRMIVEFFEAHLK